MMIDPVEEAEEVFDPRDSPVQVAVPPGASSGEMERYNREKKPGFLSRYYKDARNKLKNVFTSTQIPQNSYIDYEECDDPKVAIYRQAVARNSSVPHIVKFCNPKYIICGIACLPKDEKTASPEIEVVRGGVGFDDVEICLKPVNEGYWACAIEIMGRKK